MADKYPTKKIADIYGQMVDVFTEGPRAGQYADPSQGEGLVQQATDVSGANVPAGFTPGPLPEELQKFYGNDPSKSGYRIITNPDGTTSVEVSNVGGGSVTYGARLGGAAGSYTVQPSAATSAQAATATSGLSQTQQNILAQLQGTFSGYNLTSLYNRIVDYVKQGYDATTIVSLLRQSPEYAARFPAMKTLAAKGRAITEAEYINYEQAMTQLERRYGLPADMLIGNVTNLLEKGVAASDVSERAALAAANSLQAPKELKDTLSTYYNVGQGGLTAYFLDPEISLPLLQKQAATAAIGAEAMRQGIGLDVYGATNLQELGVTQMQAQKGFGQIAGAQELTTGAGDTVANQEMIAALLGGNQQAMQSLERATSGRVGRFAGGGEFLTTQKGMTGLGSAAT